MLFQALYINSVYRHNNSVRLTLLFWNILDLQKSCKGSAESSYVPPTPFPVMWITSYYPHHIFQNLETSISTLLLSKLQTLHVFHKFYSNVLFFPFQGPIWKTTLHLAVALVSSGLWLFLSFSVFFMLLTCLRSTGQVFVEYPSFGVCLMFFSWGYGFRGRAKVKFPLISWE